MFGRVRVMGPVMMLGLAMACQPQEAGLPTVDVAAVRTAIEGENAKWSQAYLAKDAAALAALYTEDAILAMPNAPRVNGREAIAAAYGAVFAQVSPTTNDVTVDRIEVAQSGDFAYVVGTYGGTSTMADGSSSADTGKYVAVFKNVNGQWMLAVDTWSSDMPAGGM